MKKYLIIAVIAVFCASMFGGCSTVTGPTGPSGETLYMTGFQYGVYPQSSYLDAWSAGLEEANSAVNLSADGYWAGMALSYRERMIVYFDVEGLLPVNAKIEKAYLTLYCRNLMLSSSVPVAGYRVTSLWDGGAVCWDNRMTSQPWGTAGGDFNGTAVAAAKNITAAGAYYTWEVDASLVDSWVKGTADNYGMMMKSTSETAAGDAEFLSQDSAEPEKRPKLTVYYSIQ